MVRLRLNKINRLKRSKKLIKPLSNRLFQTVQRLGKFAHMIWFSIGETMRLCHVDFVIIYSSRAKHLHSMNENWHHLTKD